HPRVRLQAVVACSYVPRAEATEVAAIAADFPADKFLSYALNQVIFALKPHWLAPFKAGKLNFASNPNRLDLLIRADRTPDTLQAVRELLRSPQLDPAAREAYLRILAENGDASDLASILKVPDASLQARLLPALGTAARVRRVRPPGDLTAALRPLAESPSLELRAEALRLAGIWKLEAFQSNLETTALGGSGDEQVRRAAIEGLVSLGGNSSHDALLRLASDGTPVVQSAAVAALCSFNIQEAAQFAAASLARLQDDAALNEIFTAVLQRQSGAGALAKAFGLKTPPRHAAELGLRVLSASGRANEQLARILAAAAGFQQQDKMLTPADIAHFAVEVRAGGDTTRGEKIF